MQDSQADLLQCVPGRATSSRAMVVQKKNPDSLAGRAFEKNMRKNVASDPNTFFP